MDPEKVAAIFNQIDTNGDGKITRVSMLTRARVSFGAIGSPAHPLVRPPAGSNHVARFRNGLVFTPPRSCRNALRWCRMSCAAD
jgi:hypothetical protein